MENLPIQVILADDKIQFQKEQDELLKTILKLRFFNPWKQLVTNQDDRSLMLDSNLELYITNKCNQKCEYCYLHDNNELYPEECNNHETIIHNLELLYEYFIANDFYIPLIDMFSGEIWHTQLGWDVLETTLEYIKRGLNFGSILIASNCYFVNNPKTLQKIQNYINEFNRIQHPIVFSISADGKILDNKGRPRVNDESYTDEYYDNLFAFAKYNNFYFHPMVSSHNVKYWIENYEWWKERHAYYHLDIQNMMLLEVRNDDWTEESINDYCKFITYLADDFLKNECHNNIELFANAVLNIRGYNPNNPIIEGYVPWAITRTDTFNGCTVATHLTVRLGDLAICPCHRTSYAKYLYGKFVVEDDMIVDIKARNPQMAIKILMGNMLTTMHGCDVCLYKNCCLKGCFGSQLESNKDPFFPNKTVCAFFRKKYSTILQYYKDKGIIDYYKNISVQEFGSDSVVKILELYSNWEEINNGLG